MPDGRLGAIRLGPPCLCMCVCVCLLCLLVRVCVRLLSWFLCCQLESVRCKPLLSVHANSAIGDTISLIWAKSLHTHSHSRSMQATQELWVRCSKKHPTGKQAELQFRALVFWLACPVPLQSTQRSTKETTLHF